MRNFFKDKTILITGGLGTIGKSILDELLKIDTIKGIRIIDNRETELVYEDNYYNNKKIRFLYGDIKDKNRIKYAMQGVDIVYHAAAMKHVTICEFNPIDSVNTNIIGTQNLIELALELEVDSFTFISTDKAVNPTNTMGATKLIGERLVHSMYYYKGDRKTKFSAVRFGNVLNSRGSVLDIWAKQLSIGRPISITDESMTRFFMKVEDAAKLVIKASHLGQNGEIFILKMPSMKIGDLAQCFLELNGKEKSQINYIGKKPGEKMHEDLILDGEEEYLYENDLMYVKILKKELELEGFKKTNIENVSSNCNFLSSSEIKTILKSIIIGKK